MSHTDKDAPYWVQVRDLANGRVEHDHRLGYCEVSDDRRDRWGAYRHHYHKNCDKYELIEWTCTKAEPYVDESRAYLRRFGGERRCWKSHLVHVEEGNLYSPLRWVSIQCVGHSRWVRHEDWPCSCDQRSTATCFPDAGGADGWNHYVRGGVPSAFVRLYYHKPERGRERAALHDARSRYNSGENLEDFDFVNSQARNSARWLYW